MNNVKVAIIGTGPAGLTAGIYAGRGSLNPIIFAGTTPGGQLTTTTEVENFSGFPEGIMGPALMTNIEKQAVRFGAKIVNQVIKSVDFKSRPFTLTADNGDVYSAETVIVSTGATARYLNLPNEQNLIGRGISACATCDAFFYQDRKVAIVGGGDTALEEAMHLSKFANEVFLIHRRDTLRASKAMQDKAFANEKIKFIWDSTIKEYLFDDNGITGAKLLNLKTNEETDLVVDGIFMAIGHNPNTKFLDGQLELDEHGFIKTHDGVYTSVPGVFACGDVQDPIYRQGIIAAGSGAMAAMAAEKLFN